METVCANRHAHTAAADQNAAIRRAAHNGEADAGAEHRIVVIRLEALRATVNNRHVAALEEI
ncbi:hypothetical protein SDC9_180022 [bioreactor metagenome]|uniref:Uncharacterized protein n=1 Tax=bioreactor metagenome TaxID=1076179 RepID=A0A645H9S3_9ZZZZ